MTGVRIHPTAIVAAGAELDHEVQVDAYAVIASSVRIGRGTRVGAHAVLDGRTTIGRDNRIFHHVSIGAAPQDLKYRGEDSELIIGNGNQIREFATLHTGTTGGGMITRVGDQNLFMNYSHIAHDCRLGTRIVVANGAQLAGHVVVEDHVIVGALVGVHQFVRIGESAILGAGAMVSQDVPPYCNATGDRARLHGLNLIGLKRRGLAADVVANIKRAYRVVFNSGLKLADALARARREIPASPEVEHFLAFIQTSERGVCR
ncbi:MAG: acyl-ACP--UDP-N-acetylglucosamine O-acyltransferase [Candidatus Binatia bacterium]